MIELENLKVAVALAKFVEVVMFCGFGEEFRILVFRSGEVVIIGVKKGGLEIGQWQ